MLPKKRLPPFRRIKEGRPDRLVEEEPLLVGKMKQAGVRFSNMCQLSYAGMKGFSERVYAVTNSPKTRN